MSNIQQYSYPKSLSLHTQQGAVLIVVLLFLILIILGGVIAVKQSTTDLRLATSDQINTLLLQSADDANENIEKSLNGSNDAKIYNDMIGISGLIGHFVANDDNKANNAEDEYIFCFRPRGDFFDINKSSIVNKSGGTVLADGNGYCNPAQPADYVSARNATMTQVSIARPPANASQGLFPGYGIGQDITSGRGETFLFDINSTAVLPSYSGKTTDVTECFKKTGQYDRVTNKDNTIAGCMAKAGVPSTVLYELAEVEDKVETTECGALGVGTGLLCTLP